jgi:hypothetical protein
MYEGMKRFVTKLSQKILKQPKLIFIYILLAF